MDGSDQDPLILLSLSPSSLTVLRQHSLEIVHAALVAVSPGVLVRRALDTARIANFLEGRRLRVIAAGKASVGMLRAFRSCVSEGIVEGVAVGPTTEAVTAFGPVHWITGGHPVPDDGSQAAGQAALACARSVTQDEALVVLLSGGASALLSAPLAGVTLEEKVQATDALLAAGVPIHELNCVRKKLSLVKGGRLAAASVGPVLTLAISDVVGPVEDDPSVIGSGPTAVDRTTAADALRVVEPLAEQMPPSVMRALTRGASEEAAGEDWSREDDLYRVVGGRADAMRGAADAAERLGYQVVTVEEAVTGVAWEVGRRHPAMARRTAGRRVSPVCVVSSGETTVEVVGQGRGGRNQELALAAVPAMADWGGSAVLASVGTDGVDGPTDAAGALVDTASAARASAQGLDVERSLADNDAYTFFDGLGDLVRTGPSGTNVGDLQVLLSSGADDE